MADESADIFKRMLKREHWLHRPWIPFLKAVEGSAFMESRADEPVLDLACGDGVFTECVFQRRLSAGLDLNLADLKKAKASGTHEVLVNASAYEMPFKSGYFASVISVCAIEHMPELGRVLSEVQRVLKPGGRFVFSVPSVYFGEGLLTPAIYKKLGLKGRAKAYADRKNARSQHYHVLSVEEWDKRLAEAGLKVEGYGYVLDKRVLLLWSFLASAFFKPLMKPVRAINSGALNALAGKALSALLVKEVERGAKSASGEGGYLVVRAVKPG